ALLYNTSFLGAAAGVLHWPEAPPPAMTPPAQRHRLEDRLFFAVNHGWQSRLGGLLVGYANLLGVAYVSGPPALLLLVGLWRRDPRRLRRALIIVLLAAATLALFVNSLKNLCDRPRPVAMYESLVDERNLRVHTMFEVNRRHSFPSGHTSTAFLIATLL